jgi:hypothetical protein
MGRKTSAVPGMERSRSYTCTWRNKWLTAEATTLDEMATMLQDAAKELLAMRDAGVVLDAQSMEDDYALLSTTDPAVAERFQFNEEDDEEDDCDDAS